jgi:lipopolysaccharide/colanic/teichoic acid biosynthesis glycosyltransferase/glycosyltransferase involved in cell wall biosynthesis
MVSSRRKVAKCGKDAGSMRVLILTQYYPPEPAVKFADLARGLCDRGHEVQIITGFPCYPKGQTYQGFRQRLYQEEMVDGAAVTRIPQFPDHSNSAIRRAMYYLSFALSAVTIGLWRARRADVILVYQSAMPIGLAAWVISRVKRAPYVLDVVDLWPESVSATGMIRNRLALGLIRAMMKFIYQGAHRINVITQGYWQNLVDLGVRKEKLSLIYCWPGSELFDPLPPDPVVAAKEHLAGRFNIVYAGAMGVVQDLGVVLEAAELLRDLPEVQFVMIGDGVKHAELTAEAQRRCTKNVRFYGRRPAADVRQIYPWADALLAHLKSDPMSRISIPSKTFAYLAAGRPILMAVEGESADLVERHKCGIAVPPSDSQALADAVRALIQLPSDQRQAMGQRGLAAYWEHYRPDLSIDKFEVLLETCIEQPQAERGCSFYRRFGKRLGDLAIAVPALILAVPLLLVVAAVVRIKLGSPVLFRQQRTGVLGKSFAMLKFRTMLNSDGPDGKPLPDEQRLTRIGKLLRATSLDELPELWNVIRGEMSLVGPRPLLVHYLSLYTPSQARRHEVKPGITGWAQVTGRNSLSWDEKFAKDIEYVDNCSLRFDLLILWKTIVNVLRRDGVSAADHATMPEFTGSPEHLANVKLPAA